MELEGQSQLVRRGNQMLDVIFPKMYLYELIAARTNYDVKFKTHLV